MFIHLIARFNLSAGHLRLGLALISLFAFAVGGNAGSRWS